MTSHEACRVEHIAQNCFDIPIAKRYKGVSAGGGNILISVWTCTTIGGRWLARELNFTRCTNKRRLWTVFRERFREEASLASWDIALDLLCFWKALIFIVRFPNGF